MILIITTNTGETTTDIVCDYLESLSMPYYRLNMESFLSKVSNIALTNVREKIIELTGTEKMLLWFRRGYVLDVSPIIHNDNDSFFTHKILNQLTDEIEIMQSWFVNQLQRYWPIVNHYENVQVNKLEVLSLANDIGIKTPATFVSEDLNFLEEWLTQKTRLITKPLSQIKTLQTKDKIYRQVTKEVKLDDIKGLKESGNEIMFSLFQEFIPKQGDVRVFYLNGKCFSVLIFTNESDKSKIDGRNFDVTKPVRMVALNLPDDLISKIQELATKLKLEACSIDFVLGEDAEFYFLEVNPVGQFGWISEICGANLHFEFANYLINKYNEKYAV